jgi:hypothetical protein
MDARDRFLLRTIAILVIASLALATTADANLFDFNPWWPGFDMCWWH